MVQRGEPKKKYMMRYKGTFDIFCGFDHRMRTEEIEEQFNQEVDQGLRVAADAAGLLTSVHAVRRASTRRSESSWQVTTTWER